MRRQLGAPSIADRAHGYGMPGVVVDGNDVLACYAVMADAAERARAGCGPTLIEAVTYRMGPHTTSDDPTRYQPPRNWPSGRLVTRSPGIAAIWTGSESGRSDWKIVSRPERSGYVRSSAMWLSTARTAM